MDQWKILKALFLCMVVANYGFGKETAFFVSPQGSDAHPGTKSQPFKTLEAAGVDLVLGVKGKIRDAIQAYLDGKYQPARESNVEGHWM